MPSKDRLTIRYIEGVLIIKKALLLALNQSEEREKQSEDQYDEGEMAEQLQIIEVLHKCERAIKG